MNLDAIPIGANPPEEVNVVDEVGIGGEPIKSEMNKAAGDVVRRPLSAYTNALSRQLWFRSAYTFG